MSDLKYLKPRQIKKIFSRICSENLEVEIIFQEDSSFYNFKEFRYEGKLNRFDIVEYNEDAMIKVLLYLKNGNVGEILLSPDYYFDSHHDEYIKLKKENGDGTYNELQIIYK